MHEALGRSIYALADEAAGAAYGTTSTLLGTAVAYTEASPAVRAIMDRVAERIVGIEATTRNRVAAYVAKAADDGLSIGQLRAMIRADSSGAFSASRAETIARTETGTVYNQATIASYRDSGLVDSVLVFDGQDDDDECRAANGQVWTLDDAEANPLEHPNCRRSFSPVIEGVAP